MTAITSPVTIQVLPNIGVKMIAVRGSMATAETYDASSYFSELQGCYLCEELGVVKIASFVVATGVVTIGTVSTGTHCLLLWGI
jgi:hypothetical protein